MARGPSMLYPLAAALLRRVDWPGRAAVARHLGVHRASIQAWLDHFAHHRAIQEDGGLGVDPDRLWSVLTAHRVAAQRPETAFHTIHEPAEASRRLDDAGVPHAFCMFTAANHYAFFEPRRQHQIYLPRQAIPVARTILGAGPGDALQVFHEAVEALPALTRAGTRITDPVLTVADLRAHPEGGAHASFLESNLPRWTP